AFPALASQRHARLFVNRRTNFRLAGMASTPNLPLACDRAVHGAIATTKLCQTLMELPISFSPYNLEFMSRTTIDWERRIGRRLGLRDLHVFITVAQRGSMAKAALELNVTQPAVSKVIADLEYTLGVRLLDRRPQGVEPTAYGRALLKRSSAA